MHSCFRLCRSWSTNNLSFDALYPYELVPWNGICLCQLDAVQLDQSGSHDRRPNSGWIGSPSWIFKSKPEILVSSLPTVWSVSMTTRLEIAEEISNYGQIWHLVAGCTSVLKGSFGTFNTISAPVVSNSVCQMTATWPVNSSFIWSQWDEWRSKESSWNRKRVAIVAEVDRSRMKPVSRLD